MLSSYYPESYLKRLSLKIQFGCSHLDGPQAEDLMALWNKKMSLGVDQDRTEVGMLRLQAEGC